MSKFIFGLYLYLFLLPFFISYKMGSLGIKKTGQFWPSFLFATAFKFLFDILLILLWLLYSYHYYESALRIGLLIGIGVFAVGEIILFIALHLRRKNLKGDD